MEKTEELKNTDLSALSEEERAKELKKVRLGAFMAATFSRFDVLSDQLTKKLKAIEKTKEKQAKGGELNADQLKKLETESEVRALLAQLEDM